MAILIFPWLFWSSHGYFDLPMAILVFLWLFSLMLCKGCGIFKHNCNSL